VRQVVEDRLYLTEHPMSLSNSRTSPTHTCRQFDSARTLPANRCHRYEAASRIHRYGLVEGPIGILMCSQLHQRALVPKTSE
jgi:hypothetical protein